MTDVFYAFLPDVKAVIIIFCFGFMKKKNYNKISRVCPTIKLYRGVDVYKVYKKNLN